VKLVETDADRPEDEAEPKPLVTPSVPEKRRAYASLIFTAVTLIGTVVTIYTVFPARTHESAKAALDAHHQQDPKFQLAAPGHSQLLAWATGVLDGEPPMPADGADLRALGARALDIRHRPAAYVRYAMGLGGVAYQVSFVVQHAEDSPADRSSRVDGPDDVESWTDGAWKCIAVGPAAQAPLWKPRLGVP
jgi:hypothetical protein